MSNENLLKLEKLLNSVSDQLPNITSKKMFGCYALWVNGNVFALIWKHGRIGVKLTDEYTYKKLLELDGAEPWTAGSRQMSHWVLVPESFHTKKSELKKWLAKAHELCATSGSKLKPVKKVNKKVTTLKKNTKKKEL